MTANVPSPIKDRETLLLARRAAGMSQSELAAFLGMVPNSISHIETGRTALTNRVALHIALVFTWLDRSGAMVETVQVLAPRPTGRPAKSTPIDPYATRYQRRAMNRASLSFNQAGALPPKTQYQMCCCVGDTPWSAWMIYERTIGVPMPEVDIFIGEAPLDDDA